MSNIPTRRGLSERELQKREEQLANTFGYQSDLIHNQDSIIQHSNNFITNTTPSFKQFLTNISTSEIGRKKRKPNHVCHAPVHKDPSSFERKEKKPNPTTLQQPIQQLSNIPSITTTTTTTTLKYREPSFPAPDRSIQYEFIFQDGSGDCLTASMRTPIGEIIQQYFDTKGFSVESCRYIVEDYRVKGHETGEYIEEQYYKTPVDSITVDVLVEQSGA